MNVRKDYGRSVRNGSAGSPPILNRFASGKLMNRILGEANAESFPDEATQTKKQPPQAS